MYSEQNGEIDVFMTNRCNSNCLMCPLSEAVRRKRQERHEEWVREYINILPSYVRYINITGGEPTLSQQFFCDMMLIMKEKFVKSNFQLLTNGRSSADKIFLQKVLKVTPNGMRFAIPVHSVEPNIHDMITQVQGSFTQTDRGIRNLLHEQQKVEVRIVVSRKNADTLVDTARYIVDNYRGVFCVNFIGMEMMGSAALNKDSLWIDYSEVFKKSKNAVDILVEAGIDVQLYNFPLCAVNRGYWHIAAKSITDYKIRYMDECEECSVKTICGGFFYSTKQVMKPRVTPVKYADENKLL
jgi:His-Xaa-Ser system radical SAM maturase HxsC